MTQTLDFVFLRVENIVGKGENTGLFSLSQNVFNSLFLQECKNSG